MLLSIWYRTLLFEFCLIYRPASIIIEPMTIQVELHGRSSPTSQQTSQQAASSFSACVSVFFYQLV